MALKCVCSETQAGERDRTDQIVLISVVCHVGDLPQRAGVTPQ